MVAQMSETVKRERIWPKRWRLTGIRRILSAKNAGHRGGAVMSQRNHRLHIFVALLAAVLLAGALCAAGAQAGGSSRPPIWLKQWTPAGTDSFQGGNLARAGTGDLFVAGTQYRDSLSRYDWRVARYTETGARKWVRYLASPAGDHWVNAVAADSAGNVIVVGYVKTAAHGLDWLVGKWSRSGQLLWVRQRDGTAHNSDDARDVAVAADGSIVVVGTLRNAGTSDDGLIVKYSPKGKALWRHLIDGASHGSDALTSLALDTTGNAYAAGFDYGTTRADDALLIRYSSTGRTLWKKHWGDSVALKHDWFSDVAVRGSSVAVAGITENDPNPANWERRGLLVKYGTAHGTLQWDRQFQNPTDSSRDASWSLVGIDTMGRVTTAGWAATSSTPGEGEWATAAYSTAGTQRTVMTAPGSLPTGNYPAALLTTAGGTTYVTGCLSNSGAALDLYTVALNTTGMPLWGSVQDDSLHASDSGCGLAATSKALYVGGAYYRSLALLKYAR
jgi:hypothetical protein